MSKKKNLLEEVDKTWSVAKMIKEANAAPAPAQTQAQPAQGQRAPQQPQPAQAGQQPAAQQQQMNPQQVQKNIETTMDQGMNALIQQLPTILKNFTSTAGDKDSQLDVPGQQQPQAQQQGQQQAQGQQQVKESEEGRTLKFDENKFKSHLEEELNEGGILGLVASAPAIMQLGGKLIGWTGKKVNSNIMQKWGNSVAHAGHKLHHKYIGALEKIITPFMKGQSKENIHQAAEAMFMTLVAGLFAGGLAAPDLLTAVKGQELASYVKDMAPKALSSLGFA